MQKNSFFYLSGLISFFLFSSISFLFVYLIISPEVKTYKPKANTLTIELDMIAVKSDKLRVEKKQIIKKEKLEDKFIKKSTSRLNESRPNVKSLFGNVKTKEKKVEKKVINNITKSIDPKRFKSKFEKQKKSSNLKIDKLLTDNTTTRVNDIKNVSDNKKTESNEYYDKVASMLHAWETPIQVRDSDLKATVIVTIYADGAFDYNFLILSDNYAFDSSLKAFLDEQKSIIYPKLENSNQVRFEVDFKSKEG
jgi:hypothetical protein